MKLKRITLAICSLLLAACQTTPTDEPQTKRLNSMLFTEEFIPKESPTEKVSQNDQLQGAVIALQEETVRKKEAAEILAVQDTEARSLDEMPIEKTSSLMLRFNLSSLKNSEVDAEKIRYLFFGKPKKTRALEIELLQKGRRLPIRFFNLQLQSFPRSLVMDNKTAILEFLRFKYQDQNPKTWQVSTGETLQSIAKKIYQTTRKWPELFILNSADLHSPDHLSPGEKLIYY